MQADDAINLGAEAVKGAPVVGYAALTFAGIPLPELAQVFMFIYSFGLAVQTVNRFVRWYAARKLAKAGE